MQLYFALGLHKKLQSCSTKRLLKNFMCLNLCLWNIGFLVSFTLYYAGQSWDIALRPAQLIARSKTYQVLIFIVLHTLFLILFEAWAELGLNPEGSNIRILCRKEAATNQLNWLKRQWVVSSVSSDCVGGTSVSSGKPGVVTDRGAWWRWCFMIWSVQGDWRCDMTGTSVSPLSKYLIKHLLKREKYYRSAMDPDGLWEGGQICVCALVCACMCRPMAHRRCPNIQPYIKNELDKSVLCSIHLHSIQGW